MVSTEAVLAVIRASAPEFRSAHDRVAFAVHATFMAAGYSLAATGSRAGSSEQELRDVGIQGWNELDGSYAFKYFTDKEKLPKVVEVRCTVINDLLMVDAVASGARADPVHLELKVSEFASEESASTLSGQYKYLDELVRRVRGELLDKFSRAHKTSGRVPNIVPARPEGSPTFRAPAYPSSFRNDSAPASVGTSDLMPGFGAGVFAPRRDPGFESGQAGNVVGPQHPLFSGRFSTDGTSPDFPDGGAPLVPPGAKFDPFGPPGVPGFEPQRFGRGSGPEPRFP